MTIDGSRGGADPGDLGRRIRERREDLGLAQEELARRAGMAAGYLDYLERRPGASPSAAAVTRLAAALQTTVTALRGGGAERPPGPGRPSGVPPVLETLDPAECQRLLAPGGVGRIVVDEPRGPVAFPLNYLLDAGSIVVRTGEGELLEAVRVARRVSFEVDHLDEVLDEGWSVLVTGTASVEDVADWHEARPLPEPWPGGEHAKVVRITSREISGRRIRRSS